MSRNLLAQYIHQQLILIEKELESFAKDQDPKCLQHIRVDLKKVFSICNFAEYSFKQKIEVEKLQSLFNKAGRLRRRQIEIQILGKLNSSPKKILSLLSAKEVTMRKRFTDQCSKFIKNIHDFEKELSIPALQPNRKTTLKYFVKLKRKSNNHLRAKNKKGFHLFRKDIKAMTYINDALPAKLKTELGLNSLVISELQRMAGDWHDSYCVVRFLKNQKSFKKPKKVLKQLETIENNQLQSLQEFVKSKKKNLLAI